MNSSDFIARLKNREVFFWRNPDEGNVSACPEFSLDDMLDAEARLARFAPPCWRNFSRKLRNGSASSNPPCWRLRSWRKSFVPAPKSC